MDWDMARRAGELADRTARPTIDLPDDERAAVIAAIRGIIEGDRYPHASRFDPLRAAAPSSSVKADKRARR
jgi:hypothetical protein